MTRAAKGTGMARIKANGIDIEAERHGPEDGAPLLLIRGLGSQIIHWPDDLIEGFVSMGRHVITYDNRDAGLSADFAGTPYDVGDMAADGIGVLDAFGVDRADIFGISMGGMIAQEMVWAHGERVRSACIVMSSSGSPDLPGRTPEVERLLLQGPGPDATAEDVVEATLIADRVWAGPKYPFDEAERRALIRRAYERAWRPDGVARQYQAVLASAGRAERLAEVKVPCLVIHGDGDVLLTVPHGRDIAERIPDAEFVVIEGMGHDLDGGVSAPVLKAWKAFQARLGG